MPARILVIEDNTANLDLMIYLLQAFGHTTYAAEDGQAGLEKASAHHPDLIICDVHMPKIDGYGVVRQLKQDPALRDVPVIAVTALAMVGDRDRVLQSGFDGYLAKPIDPETFIRQINPYLDSKDQSSATFFSAESTASAPPQSAGKATVLAVDNVPHNLELVCSLLGPFGYQVVTASGGRDALEIARREQPDLILSDICMEDGNGFDFIKCVKADPQLSSIPFVFITSSMTEEKDRSRALALGAALFLVRPIEAEKLLAEIGMCLTKPAGKENLG